MSQTKELECKHEFDRVDMSQYDEFNYLVNYVCVKCDIERSIVEDMEDYADGT